MVLSKCPHCQGGFFELKEASPRGAAYKSLFIQCSKCGAPFAAHEHHNISVLLEKQEKKIVALSRKIDQLDHNLRVILQAIQQISRR